MTPLRARALLHLCSVGLLGLLGLAGLAGGCRESVALGTECPPFGDPCGDDEQPSERADAAMAFDESTSPSTDTSRDGAAENPQEEAPSRFPEFQNPSLEITAGAASGGLISSFAVQVSDWLGCSPPGFGPGAYPQGDLRMDISSGTPTAAQVLSPSDGMSLVTLWLDGTSVAQTLRSPLVAEAPYAFMLDIASPEGATGLALEILGSNGCLSPKTLTTSAPAVPGRWTSVCVRFTPEKPYSSLMFKAVAATPSSTARLFIDNIRADASCQ